MSSVQSVYGVRTGKGTVQGVEEAIVGEIEKVSGYRGHDKKIEWDA